VATWDEYLRQHEARQTGDDEQQEAAAVALADGPPQVRHLLPTDSPD